MKDPDEILDSKALALRKSYDAAYVKSANTHVIDAIANEYFRAKFVGFEAHEERVRPDCPLIYASNHSGMAFPWDAIIFASQSLKAQDYELRRMPRALAAPMLSIARLTQPYLIMNFWKRCGCVDATTENFDTVMASGESDVLIYPEGVPGIAKGFNNRYHLQRFSSSFVRMAILNRTDIIPISTVNAEYVNPWTYASSMVNRVMNKINLPFLPLGLILLPLLFLPWIFYFGFPAQLTYVVGRRIKPSQWVKKPVEELTLGEFRALTDKVRTLMQEDLDRAVKNHGQRPYQLGQLLSRLLRKPSLLWQIFPPFWPAIFHAHERAYEKAGSENVNLTPGLFTVLKGFLTSPLALAFLVPVLGWLPVLFTGFKANRPTLPPENRS